MADNIMGGSDPDIDLSVSLRLTNIENSSAQFDSLIQQTDDWRKSIGAVEDSLGDTYEALQKLGTATLSYRDAFQEVLDLSERHESVLRRTTENARELAQASRDIQSMFGAGNLLSNMVPLMTGEVGRGGGGGGGNYGGPGSATFGGVPEGEGEGPTPLGESGMMVPRMGGGAISRATGMVKNMLETGANNEYWIEQNMRGQAGTGYAALNTGGFGGGNGIFGDGDINIPDDAGGISNRSTSSRPPVDERGRLINRAMNIPYFMPFGKAAYVARYIDRVTTSKDSPGVVTSFLQRQNWLFGETGENPNLELDRAAAVHEAHQSAIKQWEEENNAAGRGVTIPPARSGRLLADAEALTNAELGVAETVAIRRGLLGAGGRLAGLVGGEGVAALGGAAGTALGVAGAVAVPLAIAYAGYKVANTIATSAQQYASVTGEGDTLTAVKGGLLTKVGSYVDSFLSLGVLSPGKAEEVRLGAENAGFRRNSGLYNEYVQNAEYAYSKYGIDPQQYMQMFQDTVVRGKSSASQLEGSIENLGRIASKSNTSFTGLLENYDFYSQTLVSAGFSGDVSNAIATSAAAMYRNNPMMQGYGTSVAMLGSQVGQTLASMAAGTNPLDYYNIVHTPAGALQMAAATDDAVINQLQAFGLRKGMTNMDWAIRQAMKMGLPAMIEGIGVTNPNGKPWDEPALFQYVKGLLTGTNTQAGAMARDATNYLKGLAGGENPTSQKGIENFFDNLSEVQDKRTDIDKTMRFALNHSGVIGQTVSTVAGWLGFDTKSHNYHEVYHDKNINNGKTIEDYTKLSAKQQAQLRADLIAGTNGAQMVLGEFDDTGKFMGIKKGAKWVNMAKGTGQALMGDSKSQNVLVGLTPEAKKLFQVIGNTSAYTNLQTQTNARTGFTSNTTQDTNAYNNGYSFG